jgi:hypothetical protein
MKDAEDEAFEYIERKQGGFIAKRKMAADKLQEPLIDRLRKTASKGVSVWGDLMLEAADALAQPAQEPYDQTALELCNVCGWKTLIPDDGCLNCERKEKPAQERQWIWLSDADIAEVVDTTCQYTGSYEEFLIKKAERKIRSMNNG